MRVLQIHNGYLQPGGEDVVADTEAAGLRAGGHEVETLRVTNPHTRGAQAGALALAAWNPVQAAAVRRRATSLRPDVAHLHNTWFALSPAVVHALHRAGVPIVMTLHNYRLLCANALLFRDGGVCTECLHGSHWRGALHGCYRGSRPQSAAAAVAMTVSGLRRTWSLVDRFLVPSRFVADVFVRAGLPADRVTVRGNGTADPGPRPAPPSTSDTVLYAGRLAVEKGLDTLLEAWRRARPDGLRLVVVGDGPLRAGLEARRVPGVEFRGHVDAGQLRAHLLAARALVLPSEWLENFGRISVEAMAAGTPVLASQIATPAEVVGELGESWLVPAGSVPDWSDALAALTDNARVDVAGTRAREVWERRYRVADSVQRLVEIYRDALAHPVGRAS